MKDIKKLFKDLQRQGWLIDYTKRHIKLRSPKGGLVVCSKTPSCPFAIKHIQGDIKRLIRKESQNEVFA